jgi:hypothetical protein
VSDNNAHKFQKYSKGGEISNDDRNIPSGRVESLCKYQVAPPRALPMITYLKVVFQAGPDHMPTDFIIENKICQYPMSTIGRW